MATNLNLTAEVGATFLHRLRVLDGVGDPIDWTAPASTAKLQVRDAPNGNLIVEITHGAGLTLNSDGTIDIRIEASEDWVASGGSPLTQQAVYVYDLLVTQGATTTHRIVEGNFVAVPVITAPTP
jgi:hypothetical protein